MAKPKLKRLKLPQSLKRSQQATATLRFAYGTPKKDYAFEPNNTRRYKDAGVTEATLMNWSLVC